MKDGQDSQLSYSMHLMIFPIINLLMMSLNGFIKMKQPSQHKGSQFKFS